MIMIGKEETLLKVIDEKLTGTVLEPLRRAIWQMMIEAYRAGFEDGKQKAKDDGKRAYE